MSDPAHNDVIRDQFTRQAAAFNAAGTITNEDALRMTLAAAEAGREDTVLDVACGGGIVACAFAPHVRHATGIDVTPAMLERARQLAADKNLTNLSWEQGDVATLPFDDASFSIVVTRFTFHHFLDPLSVMKEMKRVCAPGGRIVVVDMYCSDDPSKAAEWNKLEKLRDPSHVRCMTLGELKTLFESAGLAKPEETFYDLRDTVKALLGRSFPNPGDETKVMEMFTASAQDDRLGLELSYENGELRFAYPTAILSAARGGK